MFVIKKVSLQDWWNELNISLKISRADCDAFTEQLLPPVVLACLVCVIWTGMNCFRKHKNLLVLLHLLVCIITIGATAVPLCALTRHLQNDGFVGSRDLFVPIYRQLQPYRLINGYGLFRRMTGVGPMKGPGWAGQPPSLVERPEIILEGIFEGETDQWTELSFRWKPGREHERPQQVAPHQPRYSL